MDLLHLGSHCLDTAQNLILVSHRGDANSSQVTAGRERENKKREITSHMG